MIILLAIFYNLVHDVFEHIWIFGGSRLPVVYPRTYERSIVSNVDIMFLYAEQTIIELDILIVGACPLVFCLSMYVRNISLRWTNV